MEAVLRSAIEHVLTTLGISNVPFSVEHPNDGVHGEYATNIAMLVARERKVAPRACAEEIVKLLDGTIEYVERIEIAGPGFINFYLARDFFKEEIIRAKSLGDDWGKHDTWTGKRVIVEYTDPNPFKEFHVGHVFTNTVGESIARLFMMAGAETKRVNYQGDLGMHVAHAVWGLTDMGVAPDALDAKVLGTAYVHGATKYKESDDVKEATKRINKALYERSDETLNTLYDAGRAVSLAYFESIYRMLDTSFDHYFFESEAAPIGKALVLQYPDVFALSDGARVFKGEEHGLHTRVFLNAEGLPTYEAKELALAKMKDDIFPYDHSIISTSNEITEYFKVLKKAMSFVYPELAEKTEHIGHGTVRLATGKMSSRTGDIITAVDFIADIKEAALKKMEGVHGEDSDVLAERIAIGAIKYATLKTNILQDAVFDKEQALSFEGNSGPYLQYTHARIGSVLEKAEALGVTASYAQSPESPYALEKLIYRFPEVTKVALHERAPHHVVHYLTELAAAFNTFYATEKIADAADQYAPYKVAIAEAVKTTLKNGLWVLAIQAPERM